MTVFPRTLFVLLAVLLMWSPQATVNGKRSLREHVRRVSPLSGYRWSSWHTVVEPSRRAPHNSRRYEPRGKGDHGLIDSKIRKRFVGKKYDNGIYELSVSKKGKPRYVTYVGSAHREGPGSINKRILEYSRGGSHKDELINRAVKLGYKVSVRAQNIPGQRSNVRQGENKYLAKYDYAWNQRNNGRIRGNVPP